jgi:hypothetical protein
MARIPITMEAFLTIVFVVLATMILPPVIRHIRKKRYFASETFLAHKNAIASVVAEHNEVAEYTSEIRGSGSFQLGASSVNWRAWWSVVPAQTVRRRGASDEGCAAFPPLQAQCPPIRWAQSLGGYPCPAVDGQ